MRKIIALVSCLCLAIGVQAATVEQTDGYVVIRPDGGGARVVRLQVVGDAIIRDDYEKVVITFAEPVPDEGIQLNAESDTDSWSGTQIAALTKGASKVTAYFSAKPGVNIKSIGFYYSWNSKQGTDDQTTLKIASAKLIKKPSTSTGISTVAAAQKDNESIYALSGQRVATPVKGINIINGKKVFIK